MVTTSKRPAALKHSTNEIHIRQKAFYNKRFALAHKNSSITAGIKFRRNVIEGPRARNREGSFAEFKSCRRYPRSAEHRDARDRMFSTVVSRFVSYASKATGRNWLPVEYRLASRRWSHSHGSKGRAQVL
jgi:hypothetical protein